MTKSNQASLEAQEEEFNVSREEAEQKLGRCANCRKTDNLDDFSLCDRRAGECGHDDYSQ